MRERTQRFFPSSSGVLYTHNAQGREWGGDIWEKEGDSSRQGDFSPIHSPQEDTSDLIVGYFPLQLPPTGSSSLGRVVTVVYKKFDFLTALQRLNKKYSFRASSR